MTMNMGKQMVMTKGCRLPLDMFCTAEAYSSLDLTNMKCNINKQSREEKENVAMQTQSNN
jgi:hypothetical protein